MPRRKPERIVNDWLKPPDTEGLEPLDIEGLEPSAIPVMPTGLDDFDDATARLTMQFNCLFCPNCEHYWQKGAALEGKGYSCCPNPACAYSNWTPLGKQGEGPVSVILQEVGRESPWKTKLMPANGVYKGWRTRR